MNRFFLFLCFMFLTLPAFASNMGNGPAGLAVWVIGSLAAIAISFLVSSEKDKDGGIGSINVLKFIGVLFVQLIVVFILGVAAIFLFM